MMIMMMMMMMMSLRQAEIPFGSHNQDRKNILMLM
jgi:hypothetical protein